ncbi:hypothetical protein IWX81_002846 [Salinibacterium sp. CAN_S4]
MAAVVTVVTVSRASVLHGGARGLLQIGLHTSIVYPQGVSSLGEAGSYESMTTTAISPASQA